MKTFTKTIATTVLLATTLLSTAAMAAQKIAIIDVQGVIQALPQTAQIVQGVFGWLFVIRSLQLS